MKLALVLLIAVIVISIGCSDAGQRRDFTLTNLRRRLESMEPGSEADRLRNGIAQIENLSTRAIRPFLYHAVLMSLKKDGQLRREVLSIEWVDANHEIVEGEIRFADYNVRFSLAPDVLFLSEGIHVSYHTVIDEIMSDADKVELRKAVQYGSATVVLFGEGRVPIDTAELSPVDDPLSE